ncbi:hypothetical protein ACHAXT_011218 [Thalassiosira profunda]
MELENNDNDDSSVESDFSGPYEPLDLNEEEMRMLKENDKYTNAISVVFNGDANPNFRFDPLSIDWESNGTAFSKNTRLQLIDIKDINQTDLEPLPARDQRVRIRNAKAFYRAVALNRSIKCLYIEGNITRGLEMEDTVSILTPFVQENSNLRSCVLGGPWGGFDLSARTVQLLASALSSCTANLKTFGLKRINGITAATMTKILDAVKSSSIEELSLDENTLSDEVANVLGNALPTLSHVKRLSLAGDYEMERGRITEAGIEAISDGLNNSSVEDLSFWRNNLGPTGGIVLAETLSTNTVLKRLDLTMALSSFNGEFRHVFSEEGWRMFFNFLQSSALVDLELGGNTIRDAQVEVFVECLNGLSSLESLDLWGVDQVSTAGWATFFAGLRGHASLRTMKMYSADNMEESVIVPALCDKTSIEGICNSNHTLTKVDGCNRDWSFFPQTGSDCKRLLEINEGADKAKVARQKIREFCFRNGENLQELVTLEVNLMPRVLECVGRDSIKASYPLIRSMPSLFSAKALGGKRKRGKASE